MQPRAGHIDPSTVKPKRARVRALFVLLAIIVAACGSSDDALDVARLDAHDTIVYHAPGTADGKPVVVLAHGCCGDNTDLAQLALTLADHGVVVFNANWTNLRSGAPLDASASDILCSVAQARDRASEFGGDPTNVTLIAWSDGAGVAVYGLREHHRLGQDCEAQATTTPDRLISLSGVFGGAGVDAESSPDLSLLDIPADGVPLDIDVLLLVGRKDDFKKHNREVARALVVAGDAATTEILPGDHTDLVSPRTPGGRAAVERILLELEGS